jgi:hypothetical protein
MSILIWGVGLFIYGIKFVLKKEMAIYEMTVQTSCINKKGTYKNNVILAHIGTFCF